jgi:elongation factor G
MVPPSPVDVPAIVGVDPRTGAAAERQQPQEPLTARPKIALDQGRRLTYLRLYAGSLEPGAPSTTAVRGRRSA